MSLQLALAFLFILVSIPRFQSYYLTDVSRSTPSAPHARHSSHVLNLNSSSLVLFGGCFYDSSSYNSVTHAVSISHLESEKCGYWTAFFSSSCSCSVTWTWTDLCSSSSTNNNNTHTNSNNTTVVNPSLVSGGMVGEVRAGSGTGDFDSHSWVVVGGFWEENETYTTCPIPVLEIIVHPNSSNSSNVSFDCVVDVSFGSQNSQGLFVFRRAFAFFQRIESESESESDVYFLYGGLNSSTGQVLSDVILLEFVPCDTGTGGDCQGTGGTGSGSVNILEMIGSESESNPLGRRWGGISWFDSESGRVFVFGGRNEQHEVMNDVWWIWRNESESGDLVQFGTVLVVDGIGDGRDVKLVGRVGAGSSVLRVGGGFGVVVFGGWGLGQNGEGFLSDWWLFFVGAGEASVYVVPLLNEEGLPVLANVSSVSGENPVLGGREFGLVTSFGVSERLITFGGRGFLEEGEAVREFNDVWSLVANDSFSCDGIPAVLNAIACGGNDSVCVAEDICVCQNPQKGGDRCQYEICFGIASNDPLACHRNGSCVGYNNCECSNELRYGGPECDVPLCNGIPADREGVCSNNGTCVAFDDCQCHTGRYIGPFCGVPTCFGVPQGPNACNFENGTCVAHDHCVCSTPSRYRGPSCEVPVCDGIASGEEGVCNGGECLAPDVCLCSNTSQFVGQFCQIPVCNGVSDGEPGVCSDNGTCISPDECICWNETRYSGDWCGVPVCQSVLHGAIGECQDNGTCVAFDVCVCSEPNRYTGQFCEVPVCNGIPDDVLGACSDNGTCVSPDECVCWNETRYSGDWCGVPVCNGVPAGENGACSNNGTCVAFDTCICANPARYTGQWCEMPVCNEIVAHEPGSCSGHGDCLSFDSCRCQASWGGLFCAIPKCDGVLSTDTLEVCSGRGNCTFAETCQCVPLWGGPLCQFPECDGILASNSTVCSSVGECLGSHECRCPPSEWGGEWCEIPKCDGILATDSGVCTEMGTCREDHTCDCHLPSLWGGDFCNITKCRGVLSSNKSLVCSGRGDCQPNLDLCDCKIDMDLWGGAYCDTPRCFGYDAGKGGCKKQFNCVSPNVCSCPQDQYSGDCSLFKCFGILEDVTSEVCNSGKGICASVDLCVCPPDDIFYGEACEEEISGGAILNSDTSTVTVSFVIPSAETWLVRHGFTAQTIHHFHCSLAVGNYQVLGLDPNCGFSTDFQTLLVSLGPGYSVHAGSPLWLIPISEKTDRINVTVSVPVVPKSGLAWYVYFLTFSSLGICLLVVIVAAIGISFAIGRARARASGPYVRLDLDASFLTEADRRLDNVDDFQGGESLDSEDVVNRYLFQIPMDEVEVGYLLGQEREGRSAEKWTTVYKSNYKDSVVALKIVKFKSLFRPANFGILEEQLSLMTTLNHPNIVELEGFWVHQPLRQLGIVMEFLENGNLKSYIQKHKKGFLDFSRKVTILRGVSLAMEYLHSLEMIHREIRPDKVLLGRNLQPKLNFDFGGNYLLLRIMAKQKGMEFVLEGHYVAPEITLNEFVSTSSDVFSFGVMLFEILTENFSPFGEDEFNIENAIASDPTLRPTLDENLYKDKKWYLDLMYACWAHSPDRRPTCSEIKATLARRHS